MSIGFFARRGAALTVIGAALFLVLPPSAEADEGMLFTGGGYGPTPELAVQAAIEDGETSASAYQLYNCEVVGEPEVFPQHNSTRGNYFTAEANIFCT